MFLRRITPYLPASLLIACATEEAASPIPASPPVSANQAYEGALCANEGEIGNGCVRPGDTCPDGGNRPAVLQCLRGFGTMRTWHCVVDETRTCTNRPSPICNTGETREPCADLGFCADGTPVPARQTCLGERWACLPVAPGCAAHMVMDAGTPDDASAPLETILTVTHEGPVAQTIYPGYGNVRVMQWRVDATETVHLTEQPHLMIEPLSGQLLDARMRSFIWNVRLVDVGSGEVLAGPFELLPTTTGWLMAPRLLEDVRVYTGTARHFAYIIDVPVGVSPDFLGTRFRARLGNDDQLFPTDSVRRRDASVVDERAIGGNHPLLGNIVTLSQPNIVLDLASDFTPRTTVKRAANVVSSTLTITADPRQDSLLQRLRVYGAANTGSGYVPASFREVVTTCGLYSGSARIGSTMAPDLNGMMDFAHLSFPLSRASTQRLDVRCQVSSTVRNLAMGDRYVLAVLNEHDDVEVVDPESRRLNVLIQARLHDQLVTPTATVTVFNRGRFEVGPGGPGMRTVTGGDGLLYTVASYTYDLLDEEAFMDQFAVQFGGMGGCIETVAILRNGIPIAESSIDPVSGYNTFLFDADRMVIPIGRTFINIAARFRATTSDGSNGCPRGSRVTFGHGYGLTDPLWNTSYLGRYNTSLIGAISREHLFSEGPFAAGDTVTVE